MKLRVDDSRGSGLILTMLGLAVFAIMTATVVVSLRALKKESVYQAALLEAESIADSCAQDALYNLEKSSTWAAGFSSKSFADGYYDASVDVSVSSKPVVTCSGYGPYIALLGRPFQTIRFTTEFLPITALGGNGVFAGSVFDENSHGSVNTYVDSYDSETDINYGNASSSAVVRSNASYNLNNGDTSIIRGNASYYSGTAPTSGAGGQVTGSVTQSSTTFPSYNTGAAYVSDNNNKSGGITPSSVYNGTDLIVNSGVTAYINSGVYRVRDLKTNYSNATSLGTLNVNITNGPVIIFVTRTLNISGDLCNATMRPGNLFIYSTSGGGQTWTMYPTYCNFYGVIVGQNVTYNLEYVSYGAVAVKSLVLYDQSSLPFKGIVHTDLDLANAPNNPVRIVPGTWQYLSKRY